MPDSAITKDIFRRHKILTGFNRFISFGLIAIIINIIDSLSGQYKDYYSVYVLTPAAVLLVICLFLNKKGYTLLAKATTALIFNVVFLLISLHLGMKGGTYLYYFPFILAFIYLLRTESNQLFTWSFMVISLIFLIICVIASPPEPRNYLVPESKMREIYFLSFFISMIMTVYFFVLVFQYHEQLHQRIMDLEKDNQAEQLRSLIENQEKNNQELMLEIRDNINQVLAASRNFLEKSLEEKENSSYIQKSRELTGQAMNNLAMLCVNLYPAVITDIGLTAAVNELLSDVRKFRPLKIRFNSFGKNLEEMNDQDKLTVFRIIQDYIRLILLSTRATQLEIELDHRPPDLTIHFLQDDPAVSFADQSVAGLVREIDNRISSYKGSIHSSNTATSGKAIIRLQLAEEAIGGLK